MGWSWALFFANEAVAKMVTDSSVGPPLRLLRDGTPVPVPSPAAPIAGVYVDRFWLHAAGASSHKIWTVLSAGGPALSRIGSICIIGSDCYLRQDDELKA